MPEGAKTTGQHSKPFSSSAAHFMNDFSIVTQIQWKIVFWCNSIIGYHNAKKFCTKHDSTTVKLCEKFPSDHFKTTWMREEWIFHRIWITMEKSFVKWAPGHTIAAEWFIARPEATICDFYATSCLTVVAGSRLVASSWHTVVKAVWQLGCKLILNNI